MTKTYERIAKLVEDGEGGCKLVIVPTETNDHWRDDGYIAVKKKAKDTITIEKEDPEEGDETKRLRVAALLARRKAKVKAQNRTLAEQAAQARRDKLQSVSKGIDQMSVLDGIVTVSKAMLSDVNYRPKMLKRKDFYRKL